MGCTPAPTCRLALDELTKLFPKRNRASDGICGDSAHQATKSDHNVGNAFDFTHDLKHGVDAHKMADQLRLRVLAGKEKRIKYIISNRRIFSLSVSPNWRKYSGKNPHDHHTHVSILSNARNSKASWWSWLGIGEEFIVDKQTADQIRAIVAEEIKKVIGAPYFKGQTVMKSVTKQVGKKFIEPLDDVYDDVKAIKKKVGA